jgi:hypothetical protein
MSLCDGRRICERAARDVEPPSSRRSRSDPGAPFSINLPFNLMTRLQVTAEQEMSEVGGVLLGSVGTPPGSVNMHDFICIDSAVPSWGHI